MTWQWENAVAGGAAGFATVAALHPLDVVRTRFQGSTYCMKSEMTFFSCGLQVSHGAIQFTVYEELRKVVIHLRRKEQKENSNDDKLLNSVDYAMLGASSKFAAILLTYPYQQRPGSDGIPKYMNSWHVIKDTFRFEGIRGFYRGMTSNLLKNVPASSITFVVYENVLSLLRLTRRNS
ncbi:hypothetical protein QJS10_CPA08g00152 [Acorus calamus]|uniref:Uncharacterized protein n=1 Tax=Acorus calamus TaxID=4465 RepID=A0AAV9EAE1_ACOCL|nr:hypothetical protein QJS10_CPA08g00152 [Acorus calamus]